VIVIIPGVQDTPLKKQGTQAFLATLTRPYVCLDDQIPPYNPWAIRGFLQRLPNRDLIVIAFSAGVVGVAGAVRIQPEKIPIKALLALDGWLVPLFTPFPCYRLSHDRFTHQTSRPLGMGQRNFWADPAVTHLDLWHHPERAQGWAVEGQTQTRTTALEFIQQCLTTHEVRG